MRCGSRLLAIRRPSLPLLRYTTETVRRSARFHGFVNKYKPFFHLLLISFLPIHLARCAFYQFLNVHVAQMPHIEVRGPIKQAQFVV